MSEYEERPGNIDIWNAFMCEDAKWSKNDIPFCPTILKGLPKDVITWTEAKSIYRKKIKEDPNFFEDLFICWYIDDIKFDGLRTGIWASPKRALKILKHFRGIITPDFSTYQEFPFPLKIYNTFRMRAFGYWIGKNGLEVINNLRWGTDETFKYCADGIEQNSVVAIGTVGGNPKRIQDRKRFENGLFYNVKQLKPHTIIVYGSANYSCFEKIREMGIRVVTYEGETSRYFSRRKNVKTT